MSDSGLWQAVLYLHLLAMALFLGGQLFLAVAVVPVERMSPDPFRMRSIARRFGLASLMALAVLVVTGAMLASHHGLWSRGTLHTKLALVASVLVLTAVHLRRPRAHLVQAAILLTTLVIVWLGLDLAE